MPKVLAENMAAWTLWHDLDESERPNYGWGPCKIPKKIIADMCELYELSLDEFEKVSYIEKLMYPMIAKRHQELSENKEG